MCKVEVSDIRQILEDWMKIGLIEVYELPESDEEFLEIDLCYGLGFNSVDEQELACEIQKKCLVSLSYNNDAADMYDINSTIRNFINLFE